MTNDQHLRGRDDFERRCAVLAGHGIQHEIGDDWGNHEVEIHVPATGDVWKEWIALPKSVWSADNVQRLTVINNKRTESNGSKCFLLRRPLSERLTGAKHEHDGGDDVLQGAS